MNKITVIFLFLTITSSAIWSDQWLIEEEFLNLDDWDELIFPKIEKHSQYSIVQDGDISYLQGKSDSSASGLIYKGDFDVHEWNYLSWKWRIHSTIPGAVDSHKKGDDYAIRIYVIFEYDPENAERFMRFQYKLAKALYGEYPPHSALNYVWANVDWGSESILNPFTDRAVMVAMDQGNQHAGEWRIHSSDILETYRKVFSEEPPNKASLAIMSDSDNTEERGRGDIEYIRIGKQPYVR